MHISMINENRYLNHTRFETLGLKIPVFPLTRPTLFFLCRPYNFYSLPEKKNKIKIFIPTDPKMFQKIAQTNTFAKIMLKIIFFNFLDVLNFIISMVSGTVDEI